MVVTATHWLLAFPEGDPLARLLAERLARPGRNIQLAVRVPAEKNAERPSVAVVDCSMPWTHDWLRWLKLPAGNAAIAVLGLVPARDDNRAHALGAELRIRPDREMREPFSEAEVAAAAEELAAERAVRPELRTLALEYAHNPERQNEAAALINALLVAAGLSEEPRFMFFCGVREAMDNARRHGSQSGTPADLARLWFESDALQVTIAVADNGEAEDATPPVRGPAESPLTTARRRNAAGRPGGRHPHYVNRPVRMARSDFPGLGSPRHHRR